MSKLGINTGITPNDGTGDTLLSGAVKINSNFDEIYNYFGDGNNLTFINDGSSRWGQNVLGIHTLSNVGIGTIISRFPLEVGAVGSAETTLYVNGNARITDTLSVGEGGVTIDGNNNSITAENIVVTNSLSGSAVTGFLTSANLVGYATEGYVDNAVASFSGGSESYWQKTDVGINTSSSVGIGTTNPTSKVTIQSTGSASDGELATHPLAIREGTFDRTLWMGYATNIGGIGEEGAYVNAASTGISRPIYLSTRNLFQTPFIGIGTDRPTGTSGQMLQVTGGAYISGNLGIGSKSPTSALTVSGNTLISGVSTVGSLSIGSTQVISSGRQLQNIASLDATTTATIENAIQSAPNNFNNLNVTGIATLGAGVTVTGTTFTNQLSVSGVVSATTFYGNLVGSITNATNLTGGTANASSLNVSGIATISAGRIQADAGANLRFGNQPAGSGSGRNIAIGDQVLVSLIGGLGRNIGIGELAYHDTTIGQYNIGIGERAGQKVSTGSYNVILGAYDGNTGNLDIRTSSRNVVIADGEGNIRQYINSSGNVGIKTTVVTEALTVAGVVSATSFYGTLNAGQLTGALPAIDGSALIGVVGSGSGVVIEDDATPVGTAGTINFGPNLSVSFASGIATVSGNGLATYANVAGIATYATTAGVSTTSGTATYATSSGVSTTSGTAGYATTAGISSAVSGTININTTGIITASSFSGSGSGLTNLPAGQLTGSLPAIDGSALLNVTAAGTGVAIHDDEVNVGSASTINFGTGLDVTFSAGIATITASGGSLQSRTTVTGVTTSIANLGIGNTDITGFKSYALLKVGLSTAGWLRLYTDSTSRANDAFRSQGEDPTPGSGVIAEVITTGISTTQIISPFVMGGNLDDPADTTIYASITNLSGTTQAITANLTILQLEA